MKKFRFLLPILFTIILCFVCTSCAHDTFGDSTVGTSLENNNDFKLVGFAFYLNTSMIEQDPQTIVVESLSYNNDVLTSSNKFVKVVYSTNFCDKNLKLFSDTTFKNNIVNFDNLSELNFAIEVAIETKTVYAYIILLNSSHLTATNIGSAKVDNNSSLNYDLKSNKINCAFDKISFKFLTDISTSNKYESLN